MKRLLRISFNNAIFSFIPVLSWMMLEIVLDKNFKINEDGTIVKVNK